MNISITRVFLVGIIIVMSIFLPTSVKVTMNFCPNIFTKVTRKSAFLSVSWLNQSNNEQCFLSLFLSPNQKNDEQPFFYLPVFPSQSITQQCFICLSPIQSNNDQYLSVFSYYIIIVMMNSAFPASLSPNQSDNEQCFVCHCLLNRVITNNAFAIFSYH